MQTMVSSAASIAGVALVAALCSLVACRQAPRVQCDALPDSDTGSSKPDAETSGGTGLQLGGRTWIDGLDCRNPGEPVDWTHATVVEPKSAVAKLIGADAHALRLPATLPNCHPQPTSWWDDPLPCSVGLAPGEEPGPDFPAGTVYLANWADGSPSIWEWDLARATVRRRLQLSLPDGQCAMRLVRTGDVLHLETDPAKKGDGYYASVTSDLKSFVMSRPGTFDMGLHAPVRFLANDSMGVVFVNNEYGDRPGFRIETFDGQARKVAERFFPMRGSSDATIFQGHLFALLGIVHRDEHGASLELVRLGRDLIVERQWLLPMNGLSIDEPFARASLFVSHGRLFATAFPPQKVLEISAEGKVLGVLEGCEPATLWAGMAETWVGRVHVLAYTAHNNRFLEWSDAEPERPPVGCPEVRRD